MGRIITPTPDWQAKLDSEPLLFNTGFALWQRGTSINGVTGKALNADGWIFASTPPPSGLVFNVSKLINDPPPVSQTGGRYCATAARLTVASAKTTLASTDYYHTVFPWEGQHAVELYAKDFAVSFSVRCSKAGQYAFFARFYGTTPDTVKYSYVMPFTINSANTWEKKIFRLPRPPSVPISQLQLGIARGFDIGICLAAGSMYQTTAPETWVSGNYIGTTTQNNLFDTAGASFDITAVALQLGHQEPVWRPEPFDFTLQRARRYFQKSYDLDTAPGTVTTNGMVRSALTQLPSATRWHAIQVKLSPPMRAIPTVTIYSPDTGIAGNLHDFAALTDLPANVRDVSNVQFHIDADTTVASPDIDFRFHYTAEAPL